MGFNAAERVTLLDYDFTTLKPVPAGLENCKGTIPEPTISQVEAFEEGYKSLFEYLSRMDVKPEPAEGGDTPKPEPAEALTYATVADALAAWKDRDTSERDEGRAEAHAAACQMIVDVCSKEITIERINAMPARVLSSFIQWLVFELLVGKERLIGLTDSPEDPTAE